MMADNVIYYPYIEVPQNEWFTRLSLYWDKINPIIPSNFELSEYMYDLMDYELIEPIYPFECNDIDNFEKAFLNYVDNDNYPISKGDFLSNRMNAFKLHVQKLGSIGDELVDRGLAYKSKYGWHEVESYTANQFMAYMAGALSVKRNCTPVTDTIQHLESFNCISDINGNISSNLGGMRAKILKVLPAPSTNVGAEEISIFKDDHGKELRKFRIEVERILQKASLIQSIESRNEYIDIFIMDSNSKIEDISEALMSSGWESISYGTLCGFTASALGLSASIAGGSLLGAIGSAFATYETGKKLHRDFTGANILDDEFLTYAVLAQDQL